MSMFSLKKTVKTSTVKKKKQDSSGVFERSVLFNCIKAPSKRWLWLLYEEFQSCLWFIKSSLEEKICFEDICLIVNSFK